MLSTYIETVPKRGYRFAAPVQEIRVSSPLKSIAVLPFTLVSSLQSNEYFSGGLQEALISELAQIRSLRVISRTSSLQYKAAPRSLAALARTLQLDVVVEGSVWFEEDRVRINIRLIDAVNEGQLWAHRFERPIRHVLVWQSEVARAIAQQIQVDITPSEDARLRNIENVHPDAHAAFLRGLYYWHQFFTEAGLRTSLSHFQKAIDLDPGYARAWAGLSGCYSAMAVQSMLPPRDAARQARDTAARAMTLDPLLAETHLSHAAVQLFFDWNWAAAERALQKSLELSPSSSMAHDLFAHNAIARGWGNQAIASVQRALDLDPMSAAVNTDLAWVYLLDRQYSKALEQASNTLEMQFSFPLTHLYRAQILLCIGKPAEAIRELEGMIPEPENAPPSLVSMLGYAYGVAGQREASVKILKSIESASKRQYVSPFDLALVFAALNQKDDAIRCLEHALDDRTPRLIWVTVDPSFDSIRNDPRFAALIARLGLA